MFLSSLVSHSITRRISATLTGNGEFYCLYCKAEKGYEQRRWQRTVYLFRFWSIRGSFGEFVICLTCGSVYDLECLDETSTAELDELLVYPPGEVAHVAGLFVHEGVTERQPTGYSPARRH